MRSMPDAVRAIVHDAIFIVAHGGALLPCFAARPGACSPRSTVNARFRQRQIALSSCREPVAPCRLPSGRGPSSRHPTVELEPSEHQSDCPAQPSRSRQAGQLPGPGRTRAFRVRGHIEAARLSLERWRQWISAGVAHRRFRGATRTASYATSKTRFTRATSIPGTPAYRLGAASCRDESAHQCRTAGQKWTILALWREEAGRRYRGGAIDRRETRAVVKSSIEAELSEAQRRASEGRLQLEHQRRTLDGLRRDGRDIRLAQDLLQTMLEIQEKYEAEVARLDSELALRIKADK